MQLMREFSGLGIFRFLFLMGLLVFLVAMAFTALGQSPEKYVVIGIMLLLVLSLHLKRRDKGFLKILAFRPFMVYFLEYLLLSLPILLGLAFYGDWLLMPLFVMGLFFISVTAYSQKPVARNNWLIRIVPAKSFEWKAGIRKVYLPFVIIWLIGAFGSFWVGAVPIVIVILGFIILGFYQNNESIAVLISRELGTTRFIWDKIICLQVYFTIMLFPLLFLFFLFHMDLWYVPLIEYVLFSFVFVYAVLLKYAFYDPHSNSQLNQNLAALGPLSMIVPIMIPVVWLLSIKFFFNAKSNLNFYLDDYN